MAISSGAILQLSLVTRVTAAPERLEPKTHNKRAEDKQRTSSFDPRHVGHLCLPCSAGAANTMDILLDVSWEVVVKDMRYIMDIQPS